ncbi:MAG TPA: ABC transporter ATP-binding protein [Candidatus Baltobacteraceae bacterium]|nr:ABC transporter ATP-binding protein [Candidatus Baltobacteraceae bacterium]
MDSSSALSTRGLSKRFGSVTAVADLTLEISRGEIFGFLGPNGAGKTTSVKMIAGLAAPSGGTGTLLGLPLGDRRARRHLGYLPELFRYQPWLTAYEVLVLHARLAGCSGERKTLNALLERVGLIERRSARVDTFSKGMQQRLGLAVALIGDPQFVLLDEPTSALDPLGRQEVRELLRDLKARSTTVFLNSHLLSEVEQVCDRVAFVTRGRIVAQGTLEEIAGAQRGVRVSAQAGRSPIAQLLQRFGNVHPNGKSVLVEGAGPKSVPALVRALVDDGAEVFAVEPVAATLEQRFFELTGGGGTQ